MADTLTFYTNPMSRGRIARWMLEEVGQPYDTVIVEWGVENPALKAINPMHKVPTIQHGDRVVTECAAVCAYLADAFPQVGLAPPLDDRAAYYRWLFFGAGPIEAATTDKALGIVVPDDKKAMVGYGDLGRVVDTLEGALAGREFIAGDRFSAADLYIASHLGWAMMFNSIESRPVFTDYVGRHFARPAHVRANEIDDALIPQKDG
ncbi:glutathione S-transferase family protein [Sphingomonas sp. 1P06PA]|uniref:glutathione S-transferase family protein n=1 Tax=Sphingomonas sp. 1P06PA TaxID=554121 RepID=UPI0039A44FF2